MRHKADVVRLCWPRGGPEFHFVHINEFFPGLNFGFGISVPKHVCKPFIDRRRIVFLERKCDPFDTDYLLIGQF